MNSLNIEELEKLNIQSLKSILAFVQQKQEISNRTQSDILNLSPAQMLHLLKAPFNEGSILTINKVENTLFNAIPIFLTIEHLLQIVLEAGTIKLTPKGNLPLKICEEITNKRYWKEELSDLYKQRKEEDFMVLHTAKILTLLGGLTRKANGKMNVTKQTQKNLEKNDRNALFLSLFQPFMSKFNWGYHDGYQSPNTAQVGWAFTLYMLHKFGHEPQSALFYAEKYLNVFPSMINEFPDRTYSTPEGQVKSCYILRSFKRNFNWLGFVQFADKGILMKDEEITLVKTAVFDALFSFKL